MTYLVAVVLCRSGTGCLDSFGGGGGGGDRDRDRDRRGRGHAAAGGGGPGYNPTTRGSNAVCRPLFPFYILSVQTERIMIQDAGIQSRIQTTARRMSLVTVPHNSGHTTL